MKRHALAYAVVAAILCSLVYLQFRSWTDFDWEVFWSQWKRLSARHILSAVVLVYLSYVLRALRWKIFLRPARKRTSALELLSPTLIGFTGLALFGRAGDLIRPYLIARRCNLTLSSQLAVWTVERIFDVGGFTFLLVGTIFLSTELQTLPNPDFYPRLRLGGVLLVALVAGSALAALLIAKWGNAMAGWIERRLARQGSHFGQHLARIVREFHRGLDTIDSPLSFLELSSVSVLMWWIIAMAFREVAHAYGPSFSDITVANSLVLLGASMIGSLIQLPAVGGGAQLAAISALEHVFKASPELAAGCGMLFWLVTSVAVVPAGLLLAHRERLSLRRLSEESAQEVARSGQQ